MDAGIYPLNYPASSFQEPGQRIQHYIHRDSAKLGDLTFRSFLQSSLEDLWRYPPFNINTTRRISAWIIEDPGPGSLGNWPRSGIPLPVNGQADKFQVSPRLSCHSFNAKLLLIG